MPQSTAVSLSVSEIHPSSFFHSPISNILRSLLDKQLTLDVTFNPLNMDSLPQFQFYGLFIFIHVFILSLLGFFVRPTWHRNGYATATSELLPILVYSYIILSSFHLSHIHPHTLFLPYTRLPINGLHRDFSSTIIKNLEKAFQVTLPRRPLTHTTTEKQTSSKQSEEQDPSFYYLSSHPQKRKREVIPFLTGDADNPASETESDSSSSSSSSPSPIPTHRHSPLHSHSSSSSSSSSTAATTSLSSVSKDMGAGISDLELELDDDFCCGICSCLHHPTDPKLLPDVFCPNDKCRFYITLPFLLLLICDLWLSLLCSLSSLSLYISPIFLISIFSLIF